VKKIKKPVALILSASLLVVFFFFTRSEPTALRTEINHVELFNHTSGMRYVLDPTDIEILLDSLRFYRASRITAYIAPALSILSTGGIYSFTVLGNEEREIGRILRGGNVLEINNVRYHFWIGQGLDELIRDVRERWVFPNNRETHLISVSHVTRNARGDIILSPDTLLEDDDKKNVLDILNSFHHYRVAEEWLNGLNSFYQLHIRETQAGGRFPLYILVRDEYTLNIDGVSFYSEKPHGLMEILARLVTK